MSSYCRFPSMAQKKTIPVSIGESDADESSSQSSECGQEKVKNRNKKQKNAYTSSFRESDERWKAGRWIKGVAYNPRRTAQLYTRRRRAWCIVKDNTSVSKQSFLLKTSFQRHQSCRWVHAQIHDAATMLTSRKATFRSMYHYKACESTEVLFQRYGFTACGWKSRLNRVIEFPQVLRV